MRPRTCLTLFGGASLLFAQTQPTFYAAWEDGREAERQGQWRLALGAYQRAASLRPASAARVLIYGNNLLMGYFPYTRMARCQLELGDPEAAGILLTKAEAQGEPPKERELLASRVKELRAARVPKEAPRKEEAAPKVEPPTPRIPSVVPDASVIVAETAVVAPKPAATAKPPAERVLPPEKPKPQIPPPAAAPQPETPKPQVIGPESPVASRPRWFMGLELLAVVAGLAFLLLRWRGRKRFTHASAFENPESMGPYRLERLLGRGGFASTYLARHAQSGQRVALKLLHPYRQDDPEFLGRFRQEARLGALLNHPNLVRLVDPGPENGTPWLAMEFVDGQRMDQFLRERGPLPVSEILGFARAIASAMAHAHAHGVVHRDLKPGNVMLLDGNVKVMDFGIARTMDSETLTTTYAFLGTPLYAAPEVQFKTQVGPAADCYSLGIMLFEMLTGQPPFKGETPFEILDKHRTAPLPDLAALRPDAPEGLLRLVERLCAKNPEERPEEAEVIRILEALD